MIVITGGTGFLGTLVVPKLAKRVRPSNIVCLVPEASTVKVAGARFRDEQLIPYYTSLGVQIMRYPAFGSVEEYRRALESIPSVTAVVYLAANNDRSHGFDRLYRDNVEVFERFIHALDGKLKNATFVYTSSVMMGTAEKMQESMPERTLKKINPYALTKLLAEHVFEQCAARYGFRRIVLRLASLYGEESNFGLMKSVGSLAKLSSLVPIPYLPGRASIVHVDDAAEAVVVAAAGNVAPGAYSVDDGEHLAIGELVSRAASHQKLKARQIRLPNFMFGVLKAFVRGGVALGMPAALQFLALVDDIYLAQGKSIWSGVSFKPRSPFEERKVPAAKVVPEVAVLGASGFIGSRIVAHLAHKGIPVRCGVHTRKFLFEHLDAALIEFFLCDTSDPLLLSAFLKGRKILIYAAGLTTAHGKQSWEEYLSANVHDVLHIVSAAREAGIEKFVFLGSQAPSRGRYGFSKALGEEVVRGSGLNYVILKPGFVVGWQGLASAVIGAVKKLPLIPVPRKSAENTELVDVETVAKAVAHVIDDRSYNGKTIYLGSTTAVSLEDIIDIAARVSRKKVVKIPIPRFFLEAGSIVANAVLKKFPLNAEVIEGIYRQKPALPSDAMRLFDEEPADVLRRYVL